MVREVSRAQAADMRRLAAWRGAGKVRERANARPAFKPIIRHSP